MTPIKLEEARTASLELVANAADLRRDIHVFVDYVRSHEIKRGHRDNGIPAAHRQRLAKLMSDPATAASSDEDGYSPWLEHADEMCLALEFVSYDTKGIYAGYTSSEPSFPDNYIKFESKPYNAFLGLSLQEQEERILNIHLQLGKEGSSELFSRGPLSRLDPFDTFGCGTGVVPTLVFPKIRRRLLDLLAECPAGVWFSTSSLIEHLRLHDPWFLIPEKVPAPANKWEQRTGRYSNFVERKRGDWGHRDPLSDRDPEGFAKVEGRFVERFLEGIPLLLGYTEVAYVKRKTPAEIEPSRGLLPAFRVTERLRPAVRREIASPRVTVLPNFEVHVESLFFPAGTETRLRPLGELAQRGIVTVFKLSKPRVAAVMAANPKVSVMDNLIHLSGRALPANVEQELSEWAGHSEKFILYEGFGLLEGRREGETIAATLRSLAKYPVPQHIEAGVRDFAGRYGCLRLTQHGSDLLLRARDLPLAEELARREPLRALLRERVGPLEFIVPLPERGRLKHALIKLGFPTEDLAGYVAGEAFGFEVGLRPQTLTGLPFAPRPYQREAADLFHAGGEARGGSGVIVLPCGAGKTIVGAVCMTLLRASTLILATNVTAARQWQQELLDKTTLPADAIGQYNGDSKDIRPVTIATYQILTHRPARESEFTHFRLFDERDWGLIIYDEVHLLPAPVFQVTATLQARRRLGLTATLVREDGRADEVFALIGPKKYDVPWKEMESQGWIAKAVCTEIRLPMSNARRMDYALAASRHQFRVASENPGKLRIVRALLERHRDDPVLIIGTYLEQIDGFARELGLPLLKGSTAQRERDEVYERFRNGGIKRLVVSKIANFSVDLPDAAVAIQVSGMFGSRQEEAQRLGRILRPKPGENQAHFYSIVSRDTVEQEFAMNRQLFLCEQGYEYRIVTLENAAAALPGESK